MKARSFTPIIIAFVAVFNITASVLIIAKNCEALRVQKHTVYTKSSTSEILI